MVARLSASRSMVAISSTVGKDENSSGFWMNSAVIRIRTEKVIETASSRSSSSGGSGTISTTRIAMMPIARPMSDARTATYAGRWSENAGSFRPEAAGSKVSHVRAPES